MTPYEKGMAAYLVGMTVESNPYQATYMRQHPWSGWRSECLNPAHSEWDRGFAQGLINAVKEIIVGALRQRGSWMSEVDLGLVVLSAYDGELSSRDVRSAVSQLVYCDEMVEGRLGMWRLKEQEPED